MQFESARVLQHFTAAIAQAEEREPVALVVRFRFPVAAPKDAGNAA